jgi:L-ascorbate metabolism protein UlaG (beta-lactamase superfamily)
VLDHDHLHRQQGPLESGIGLALSLRFLRGLARRLVTKPVRRSPVSVAPPAAGLAELTFVGHATAMLTTSSSRILTDPFLRDFLYGVRRTDAACIHPADLAAVDLVLISHAHRDHLDPSSLRRLPRSATVVVPPRCERVAERLRFADVIVLHPGEEIVHRDVVVTAVAARHDGATGFPAWRWRGANGYIVRCPRVCVYFAGDTAYFSGMAEIGQRYRPDVALLPIAGYEPAALRDSHMSPLDAITAFEDLGARLLVPIGFGSFPLGYEPADEPLRWLVELAAERGHAQSLAVLAHGETCHLAGDLRLPR